MTTLAAKRICIYLSYSAAVTSSESPLVPILRLGLHHGFLARVKGRVSHPQRPQHAGLHPLRPSIYLPTATFPQNPLWHFPPIANFTAPHALSAEHDQRSESRYRRASRRHGQEAPEFVPAVGEVGRGNICDGMYMR